MLNFVNEEHIKKLDDQRYKTLVFHHTTNEYNIYLIAEHFKTQNKTLVIACPNLSQAQQYYDTIQQIVDSKHILFYPADQTLTHMMALGSPEFKSERIYTLTQLMTNKPFIVITNQEGLGLPQLAPEDYQHAQLSLILNQEYKRQDITEFFVRNGYQHAHTVEKPSDFSVRGNIIDFYSLQYEHPIRLDFFGDTLETIKFFDVVTQRSKEKVDTIEIMPLNELFYTEELKNKVLNKLNHDIENQSLSSKEIEKLSIDIDYIEQRKHLETLSLYIPLFTDKIYTLFDYINVYQTIVIDMSKMELNEQNKISDLQTYKTTMNGEYFTKFLNLRTIHNMIREEDRIFETQLLHEEGHHLNIYPVEPYKQNINLLIHDLKASNNKKVYVYIPTKHLKEVFTNQVKSYETILNIEYTDNVILGSFRDANKQVVYLEEQSIFNKKRTYRTQYRSVLNQATKIRDIHELEIGDFVVHYDYGIGQYVGLKTMELGREKRDYLQLVYANEESLYVPVDQIDRVLKYSVKEGLHPKLSKLGSKSWSKTKADVRAKIKDLSDRLIKLYSAREQVQGTSFKQIEDLEASFALDFPYQPTKDQEKAIIETLHDMEQAKPMDRLICGDVGFGKTEVALRAAFKCVANAKQTIVLVPTTVLARQHYYTFKERFEKFGISVGLLSRFVTKKEQNETIDKLKKGLIDIVIGTHRILSKDIIIKDLGLFIIDEEQRFGVEQKEKIRELKQNVDTLTLSATPIPRTLQMSMMGLKDVSMIETPPRNRYPVQTYLVERNDALIKEAIDREIARGGQVFYLFNRVQGMLGMVKKLQKLVPNAKITYAHGKLPREELEETLSEFIDHEYDILISTTIIETGIDIPNTNTLIIHEANKLGLSQLYQIRGRVGRSDRIAYAYLFYENVNTMNDEARKRLTAIEDFTALGSGYKIALRDLSIRGAGDLLGQEQSGFIDSVGYELYTKLVEEAVTGKVAFEAIDPKDNEVFAPRHIDPEYVPFDEVRIEIHKRISELNSMDDINRLKDELIDRFGPIDRDLRLYMYEKLFKKLSHRLGIIKTDHGLEQVKFTFSLEATRALNNKTLVTATKSTDIPVQLDFERGHIVMKISTKKLDEHWLYIGSKLFEKLLIAFSK